MLCRRHHPPHNPCPGPYGIGEIGPEAFKLVDWMVSAGLTLWQGESAGGDRASIIQFKGVLTCSILSYIQSLIQADEACPSWDSCHA